MRTVGILAGSRRRSTATLVLSDSFTGSNGSALSASWTTGYTGTGASTAIQGNKGRWLTGTGGGYAGTARISRRAVITSPADVEVTGTYAPQGESYPEIYVRCSDTVFDTGNGYALRLPTQGGSGNVTIEKYVAYAGTTLGTAAFSATSGTVYGFRFQVIGTALKGRIWNTSGAEPGTWDISTTDGTITAAGNVGFSVGAGAAASTYADFDDVAIYLP